MRGKRVTGDGVGVVCMLELWYLYVYVNLWLVLMKFARCLEPVVEREWYDATLRKERKKGTSRA